MKNVILLILNSIPMAVLIVLYMFRAEMTAYLFIAWFVLCLINTLFLHKLWHLAGMNIYLALLSAIGIYANCLFYYSFVYYDSVLGKTAWQNDLKNMLIYIALLTILGIIARFLIKYIAKKRVIKDKYRIIKISGDTLLEVIADHFIKHQKEYTNLEYTGILYDYSIDWEKKSFIFALKREKDLTGSKEQIDLSSLHEILPDTTDDLCKKGRYRDYRGDELKEMIGVDAD